MKSYFLTEKEGRRPLQKAMIQALLPTDSEAPKLQKKEEKKDAKKEEKKVSAHSHLEPTHEEMPHLLEYILQSYH